MLFRNIQPGTKIVTFITLDYILFELNAYIWVKIKMEVTYG